MTELKLSEIMDRIKAHILPKTFGAAGYDGIDDPIGDAEILTAARRGSLLKDTNGKLYYPTKGGFTRSKTTVLAPNGPAQLPTTDDTIVAVLLPDLVNEHYSVRFFTVYQNSGGALTFYIYADAGGTQLVYSQAAIASGVPTALTNQNLITYGTVYVKWSAAAGGTQYAVIQYEKARHISDV